MYATDCITIALLAFLVGSIPFGILLAKLFGLPDPRTLGSGNIGATNMLRTGRKDVAALTLLLDALKGALPVIFVDHVLHGSPAEVALALLGALIGHCYTPWLKGKGGKGVATALGGAYALNVGMGLVFCIAWFLLFKLTRYVSLASIASLITLPVCALFFYDLPTALILAFAAAIGIWRHKENIKRLRAGTEPKMGGKRHG